MKIYKYRSFEDIYTKRITKMSSLHFSNINTLNDPLDCHLFFKEKYNHEDVDQYIHNREEKDKISAESTAEIKSLSNNGFNSMMKK